MSLTARDKKLLIVLGVLVLVAAAVFMVNSRRSSGEEATQDFGVVAPTPSPSATVDSGSGKEGTPKEGKKGKPDATAELVFSGRDPFLPLDGSDSSGTSTSTSSSTSPSVSPAGTPEPGPGGGSSATIDGHTVVLVDLFEQGGADMAQVEVDGTVYTVGVGDTFAESFKVDAIVGTCADFLYGDHGFTLCETAEK